MDRIAACAGAGASLAAPAYPRGLAPGSPTTVYVTGEMSHHEVLAATQAGMAVVLTHHSKCERGFLAVVAERLRGELAAMQPPFHGGVGHSVVVSATDADPLTIV